MDALLLGLYALAVWLIFFKFKWLPWNTTSMVIVFTIPVVAITLLILTLNVVAPSTHDVRVVGKVLQAVPQVRGRIVELPAEGNRRYSKGEVLLRIDPTPYQAAVRQLEVRLGADDAALAEAESSARQLSESVRGAAGRVGTVQARLSLARQRVKEHEALLAAGAGSKFDREDALARQRELEGELVSAQAAEDEARQKLSAKSQGEFAVIATARAKRAETEVMLENARWELEQTVYRAPSDGTVVNLQVRVGTMLVPFPFSPAFSFVEDQQEVIALYRQNELYNVREGDLAEIYLPTSPGEIIKAKVNSIVWAQSQGQIAQGGMIPNTGATDAVPNRFAVKFDLRDESRGRMLPVGAIGAGAIYTKHMEVFHIIRMVFLRVSSKLNYLVFKLH
ncbi:HlyD family secretion protein [Cupriavidus consociatus]|uniref:HlyD family secretion protein n=1 Tax=Cupriavidus consociatus TaxID=2821357 RepID=UPI001AE3963C|nr:MULTISPECIES: biotin/lipoyl-binding protein [unclassified Cupriavidus]MBP0620554.1 HlyD family secretion protein [Cupriavidus sp. LEh25]MDK2657214.1 biotin/lipoyl-binding protein [Cupriavidus sp. LEh21]